jgi:putative flippase GtrA
VTRGGGREIARQFTSFAGVGTLGFIVDVGLFSLLQGIGGWSIHWARAMSATCSITATWALNRQLTFSDRRSASRAGEYLRYLAAQLVGLAVNLGTFSLCLLTVPQLRRYPIVALAIGAAVALLFNFITARTVAFPARPRARSDAPRPQ